MSLSAAPHGPSVACDPERGCITCADEGVAMRVTAVGVDDLGSCEGADGSPQVVDLALVAAPVPRQRQPAA